MDLDEDLRRATDVVSNHSEATQLICAATYLDEDLRRTVRQSFADGWRRALVPWYGVDNVALVQHARFADLLTTLRDISTTAIGIATIVGALAEITIAHGVRTAELVVGTVAFATLLIVMIANWTRLRRIAVRYVERELGKGGARLFFAGLTSLLAVVVLGGSATTPGLLQTIVGGIICVWAVSVAEVFLTRTRAVRVRDCQREKTSGRRREVTQLAPQLRPKVATRLERLAAANVLLYASEQKWPFLGAGEYMADNDLAVDVSLGTEGDDDERMAPRPLTVRDLVEFLAQKIPVNGAPVTWAGHRLYADGERLGTPAKRGSPLEQADLDLILSDVDLRLDDRYKRAYFCLQAAIWRGEIVIGLLIRPRLRGTLLRIETVTCAILPVKRETGRKVRRLPADLIGLSWHALRDGTVSTLTSAHLGPWRPIRAVGRYLWSLTRRLWLLHEIRLDRAIDFGATSLRGEVTTAPEDLGWHEAKDMADTAEDLNTQFMDTLEFYLSEHRIDTKQLARSKINVTNKIQAWVVGKVSGQNVNFGNNNMTTSAGTPQSPSAGGASNPADSSGRNRSGDHQ